MNIGLLEMLGVVWPEGGRQQLGDLLRTRKALGDVEHFQELLPQLVDHVFSRPHDCKYATRLLDDECVTSAVAASSCVGIMMAEPGAFRNSVRGDNEARLPQSLASGS